VGVASLVAPITILRTTVRKDIPFAVMASAWLVIICGDGTLSRFDAATMFFLFLAFMYISVKGAMGEGAKKQATDGITTDGTMTNSSTINGEIEETEEGRKRVPLWKSVGLIVLGLACLVGGSNIFVEGATEVAAALGVSDAVIGLTVVAMGTSMPELATTVVSARKGNSGIAIGNVLGSNVFNILMVLGLTGIICPMTIQGITQVDFTVLVGSMILLWLFSFTKLTIQRWEGAVLTIIFMAYLVWLIVNV
jgi:cation:H+ antiporter